MKTKDLIAALQEADPSGELEVCNDANEDIYFVETQPAYYDGVLQVLARDRDCRFYNVTGGKFTSRGNKVRLHTLSLWDVVENDPETAKIDYSEIGNEHKAEILRQSIEKQRQKIQDIQQTMIWELFVDWVAERVDLSAEDVEDSAEVKHFFHQDEMHLDDPMPVDIVRTRRYHGPEDTVGYYPSNNEIRIAQWGRELLCKVEGGLIVIERLHPKGWIPQRSDEESRNGEG